MAVHHKRQESVNPERRAFQSESFILMISAINVAKIATDFTALQAIFEGENVRLHEVLPIVGQQFRKRLTTLNLPSHPIAHRVRLRDSCQIVRAVEQWRSER